MLHNIFIVGNVKIIREKNRIMATVQHKKQEGEHKIIMSDTCLRRKNKYLDGTLHNLTHRDTEL